MAASDRLFDAAPTPQEMGELSEPRIAELIYPAGFYRTKAGHIHEACRRIVEEHGGEVPPTLDELTTFPGVGRKTANLVLGLGFGIDAICVDTHVHRISNRLGWVATRSPEATELALMEILPRRYWIEINELLVGFGQNVCTPLSPWCSRCPLEPHCPRAGVEKTR